MKPEIKTINNKELEVYDVSKMSVDVWRGFRASLNKIGGSDVGTICGLNKYKDPLLLFYEKIGLKEDNFAGNIYTTVGSFLEDSIRKMWCYGNTIEEITENYGKNNKIREAHDPLWTIINPAYPWLAANTDGFIEKDPEYDYMGKGIIEIKKISKRASEQYLGGIPPQYIYQLHAYMLACNAPYGYIAAFVGENDFISIPYIFNEEISKEILESCLAFEEAVNLGKDIMKKNISLEEKLKEIYVIEDSFDVLQILSYDKLSDFLGEDAMVELRTQKIAANETIEDLARDYHDAQQAESQAKKEKSKFGALLKKELTQETASEVDTWLYDGNSYNVKYKKRLIVNKKDE